MEGTYLVILHFSQMNPWRKFGWNENFENLLHVLSNDTYNICWYYQDMLLFLEI